MYHTHEARGSSPFAPTKPRKTGGVRRAPVFFGRKPNPMQPACLHWIISPLAFSSGICYFYPEYCGESRLMTESQRTVLIVEDEPDAAEMFAEMMRVSGFRVVKSHSS